MWIKFRNATAICANVIERQIYTNTIAETLHEFSLGYSNILGNTGEKVKLDKTDFKRKLNY